ncbi:MAG: hypothetical protein LUQ39_05460 [Methanomassiliicoccales archaeon]|jgi:hypothetical protein|nr:hypothetical protein [Methanomassiliicoccales archaeon]
MKHELDNLNLPFMAKSAGPPWLPAPVVESREIAWWTQWVMGLLGILYIISGIVSFFTIESSWAAFWAGYILACGVVYFIVLYFLKKHFFDNVDQGKFQVAANWLVLWAIVGLFLALVPGVLLLLSYIRLRDVFQPNYQPYPTGSYQTGATGQPPAQGQTQGAPPAPQTPPAAAPPRQEEQVPEQPKKTEMVKCKKCGVMYPSFMRTCPNCNEPR